MSEATTIVVMTTFDPSIGKSTQWKKGQASPNPGGRPKSKMLSQALTARLGDLVPDDPAGRTVAELLADNLITLACSQARNSVAAAEIANRVEGRVHERVEFTDLTQQLGMRSDDELRFFLGNGCWPGEQEEPVVQDEIVKTK